MPKAKAKVRKCRDLAEKAKGRIKKKKEDNKQHPTPNPLLDKINNFFANGTYEWVCPDLLVGSSSLHQFLIRGWNCIAAHKHMRSKQNQFVGSVGECAAHNEFFPDYDHPYGVLTKFKFVCATPDFIMMRRGEPVLVEVKTSKSVLSARQMFNKVSARIIIQIWVAMEIFHLRHAVLAIYSCGLSQPRRYVKRYGVINIEKQFSLFDDRLTPCIVKTYATFFSEYLDKFENHKELLNDVSDIILKCSKVRQPTCVADESALKRLIKDKRVFLPHTPLCH